MGKEISWERADYTSRVDVAADKIEAFVAMELATIDESAARASARQWEIVCKFFKGCARAAQAQGNTPEGGGNRIADDLKSAFPCRSEGSNEGFYEFMDWLSKGDAFEPSRLRRVLEHT